MNDENYLQRCLELAALGLGKVSPNPMVGCVIVCNGEVIGEGYHQQYGGAHAEVNAINAVLMNYGDKAAALLKAATVYVNLEPCAHFGKTPPCADLLIKHQVKCVVIGNTDPFESVNGKGIAKLTAAGIVVKTGVLAQKCSHLNRRFFTRLIQQRPFIILKWAQTANGYFAPPAGTQQWISGKLAKQLSHKWRSEEDAILVGKNTALTDNPALTTRLWPGKNPIRLVVDSSLSLPQSHTIFNQKVKTIIFNEIKTTVEGHVHFVQMEDMRFYLAQKIAFQLYLMDIQSVIVEGGQQLLQQFIDAGLWDEARIFTSNDNWAEGIKSPVTGVNKLQESINIGKDQLNIYTRA